MGFNNKMLFNGLAYEVMNSIRFESGNQFFLCISPPKRIIRSPKTTTVLIQYYTQADGTRGKISANVVN